MVMGVLAFHTGMRDEPPKNASPQKRRLWEGWRTSSPKEAYVGGYGGLEYGIIYLMANSSVV